MIILFRIISTSSPNNSLNKLPKIQHAKAFTTWIMKTLSINCCYRELSPQIFVFFSFVFSVGEDFITISSSCSVQQEVAKLF